MLTARSIAPLLALALASAAQAQFGTVVAPGVRYANVALGDGSSMARPGLYQFYDNASLRNHWQKFGLKGLYPPKVDWAKDQVILIHLGQRATGGYSVTVGGMEKRPGNTIRITAVESAPLKGQMTAQMLTSPYVAIAVDRIYPRFELAWTLRAGNGLLGNASLPAGSTVYSYPGNVTVVSPRIGPCDFYGGDYFSLCSTPGEFWVDSDRALYQYGQRYLGDGRAIRSGFDWRTERLLAVHLGALGTGVGIEKISFEQKGDRGVLWLAKTPMRGTLRAGPISPFALLRVARDVKEVEVHWAKRDK